MPIDIFEHKGIKQNINEPKDILSLERPEFSKQILSQIERENALEKQQRTPQLQEEFSNPTIIPGFENLSQKEKLERIKLSQFDPANYDPTSGRFVPPGTYESPATRFAATIGPTLIQPEISLGGKGLMGLISHYGLNPLLNLGKRIGIGTAGTLGYQLPEIKNVDDLKEEAKKSLSLNALLEIPAGLARLPGYIGELFNPVKFAQNKINTIKNEYQAAKALQQETYRPVMEQYGGAKVTENPSEFLNNIGIDRKKLYTDAKDIYDQFLKEPNFQNLHDLQSQVGQDWSKIINTKPNRAQLFNKYRNNLLNKAESALSHDENALNSYKSGSNITKNLVKPYESSSELKKYIFGTKNYASPQELYNTLKKGTEKIVRTKGTEAVVKIPEGHALRNHMKDLERIMNFSNLNKIAIPGIAGTIGGELLHPGIGGVLGGGTAGLGAGAGLMSQIGNPSLTATVQNPLIQNIFSKRISPLYYGIGRTQGE